jgi:hypothetical protein
MMPLSGLLLALLAQECGACATADPVALSSATDDVREAFTLALSLSDCSGATNLESCRGMERHLTEAFDSLSAVVDSQRAAGSGDCLACDPRPEIVPLGEVVISLGRLLEAKGHGDFGPALRRMEGEVELWKTARCCAASTERSRGPKPPDREDDVRAVLTEKCGADFVDNRRGLRQVMRAPGDRQGCFQSRACRKTESREGLAMEAGFWTYDGEYWYIWAERRTPQGEWVTCDP